MNSRSFFKEADMKVMEYSLVIHEAEEGGYWLEVPALEGCLTQGETIDEVLENAKEAISLYLEGLTEVGKEIPKDDAVTVRRVEVSLNV
jgi:predicted RNase H-like HicB family nuclease